MNIKSVEARNFLSFGDVLNKVDLHYGVNLVTGVDSQKKRSNGAGKTSFMEIVIFALYGQVSKGLKQSQIINWKNKKECEAKVTFDKDGIEYVFHRGLKPNFIKVYKNGAVYPINSSVKEFQTDLEDQIIGMDFKTFSLIYSNPNNSISLLDTPKAQKRQFIEKQFNLTEFSALNAINNDFIKDVALEIHDVKKEMDKNFELVEGLEKDKAASETWMKSIDLDVSIDKKNKIISKISLVDTSITTDTLDKLSSSLSSMKLALKDNQQKIKDTTLSKDKLKQELIGIITTIKLLKSSAAELTEKISKDAESEVNVDEINSLIADKNNTISELTKKIESLKVEERELREKITKTTSAIKHFSDQKRNLLEGMLENVVELYDKTKERILLYSGEEDNIQKAKDDITANKKDIDILNKDVNDNITSIAVYKEKIKALNIDSLEGKVECPTCHQGINYEEIKYNIDSDIAAYRLRIASHEETLSIVQGNINERNALIKDREEIIENCVERLKKKQELEKCLITLKVFVNKQKEIEKIDDELSKLSSNAFTELALDDITKKIVDYERIIDVTRDDVAKFSKSLIEAKAYNDRLLELININKKIDDLSNYSDKKLEIDRLLVVIKEYETWATELEQEIEIIDKKIKDGTQVLMAKKSLEEELKNVELEITHKKDIINRLTLSVENVTIKINDLLATNHSNVMLLDHKTEQHEHFLFIKEMLKDDNIKQFAISNMIPIIERQANYYLGEAGFNFYLKLDSWIDAEIKGPGISDSSFASMSGGERKSIDLALKFAIMDISMARNPGFPNILILDELLDSSVDSYGIHQLVEVVKVKQKKHNLKVFIISHRQEMDEIEPDNKYLVIKKDGYSTISLVKE